MAVNVLLAVGLACASESGIAPSSQFRLWSVAVTACADGINGGIPDGRCNPGVNGDDPLQLGITLQDMAGNVYASGTTDPVTGTVNLTAQLPKGYSPHIGYPGKELPPGKSGDYLYPIEPVIVSNDGSNIVIELPYGSKPESLPET